VTLNNGTNLQILGSGIGPLQITANITQAGGGNSSVTINKTGTAPLFTGGLVRLGGTNTFAGGVNLTAGNLVIASNTALGSGTFSVNGGSVQFDQFSSTAFTISNPITLNSTLVLTGLNQVTTPNPVATFGGPISGAGGITLSPTNGSINFALTGANTFAGPVTVQPLGNTVTTATFGTSTVATGTAAGASGFSVFGNSSLTLDNTAGVLTRLSTVTPPALTLQRANVNLLGNATAGAAESFGALTVGGTASVSTLGASTTAQTTTLTFASLTRPLNGTISFTATNLGSGTGAGESIIRFTADPGGAVGGGGGAGTTTRNVLPYAFANSAAVTSTTVTTTAPVVGLVRWDSATQRIVPLSPATEYATNLFLARDTVPAANHRYASTAAAPSAFGVAGLVNPTTVNALVLDTNTAAANPVGVSVEGPATLTVSGGVILSGINGSNNLPGTPSMINAGGLNFGAATGYVHTAADLMINSPVGGSGGLVKSGFGTLVLNGTNSFTGGLTANSGIVQFSSDANLGASGQPITLNSGVAASSVVGALTYIPNNLFTPANGTAVTVNRPVTVGPAGTSVGTTLADNFLTLPGPIGGTGQLFKTGAGVLGLTGSNTYTGNTVTVAGILTADGDAALGDPSSNVLLAGGTFQPTASFSTSRNVLVTGFSTVFTGGQNLTINGNVGGQAGNIFLVKAGTGDLILTARNTFATNMQIGDNSPTVRATSPTGAQVPGRVILTGPNGSLPLANSASVNSGGEIVLDNTAAVNNNRLPTGASLAGGSMTLLGNASAPVNEVTGGCRSTTASPRSAGR
jgi:autotransporter-associated beta strand protein